MLYKVSTAIIIACSLIGCLTATSDKLGDSNSNQAPTYKDVSNHLVEAGETVFIELHASDPEEKPLNYSVYNMPTWLSLNPSTGTITGTPSLQDIGLYEGIKIDIRDNITSVGPFFIQVEEELFDVNISWSQVTEDINNDAINNIAGYKIYMEESSARFNSIITVEGSTETSFTIKRLAPSSYTFTMTAYLTSGLESKSSSERAFIL